MLGKLYKTLVLIVLIFCTAMPSVMAAETGYAIEFIFSAQDENGKIIYSESGSVLVCGGKYRFEIPEEVLIVSDGVSQWVYNPMNEEIMISKSEISKQLSEAVTPNDIAVKMASLFTGEANGSGAVDIKSDKNNIPIELILKADDIRYRINIESFVQKENIPQESFKFNVKNYPEAMVTDLR